MKEHELAIRPDGPNESAQTPEDPDSGKKGGAAGAGRDSAQLQPCSTPSRLSAEGAARIALRHALNDAASLPLHDRTAPNVYKVCDSSESIARYYAVHDPQAAWHVFLPWFDGAHEWSLRSTRVIAVSKDDGQILYDGSAHDEG